MLSVMILIRAKQKLEEDILSRYNNSEYWDMEVFEDFCQDCGLSEDEIKELKIDLDI